jgi:hypothetical protein
MKKELKTSVHLPLSRLELNLIIFKDSPIPVVVHSKAWVYSRSLAGIVSLNPAGGIDACLLGVLCILM